MNMLPIENYPAYLQDESRQIGTAEGIVFPESPEELAEALRFAEEGGFPVTIQGARTGLKGAAVPHGGVVICLERMNKILALTEESGAYFMRVEAGVTLGEIEKRAQAQNLFFPVDPTEKSATIGGVFASKAIGLSAFYYGDNSQYFSDVLQIGAAVAELTLRLFPLPKHIWGLVFFFADSWGENAFMPKLQNALPDNGCKGTNPLFSNAARLVCAEYFDEKLFRLLAEEKETNSFLKALSPFPDGTNSALYLEIHSDDEAALDGALAQILDLFSACGGLEENTWAESGLSQVRRFRDICHAGVEISGSESGIGGQRFRLIAGLKSD